MNDCMALITQRDARHIQEKGTLATHIATGETVYLLKMKFDFEVEIGETYLTGKVGDYATFNPKTGEVGMLSKWKFDWTYEESK